MDMDEVQTQACRKIPRSGNGISGHQTEELNGTGTVSGNAEGGDSGINRLREWNPSSRIIRVSRASGGKDRHSKVWTSKGLRDRRVRLSVSTAIQFYDLQDRLGYDQPSKAVEWLIKSAADSIAELPSINTSFPDTPNYHHQLSDEKIGSNGGNHQNQAFSLSKSTCSSTSDTSKNSSGLSLSRSEIRGKNRVKARERARQRATKEKEQDNNNNNIRNVEPQNSSSFTQLLTGSFGGGDNSPAGCYSHQGYNGQFQLGTSFPHHQRMSIVPPFSISGELNHHHQEPRHKFSFVPESLYQMAGSAGVDFGTLNFSISSSSSSGGGLSGYNRGTLQSNSPSLFTTNVQRFSSSSANVDGADLPFFIGSTASPFENHHNNNHNNHPQHHEFMAGSDGSLQLYYNDGNRCSSDHKDRGKSGSFD